MYGPHQLPASGNCTDTAKPTAKYAVQNAVMNAVKAADKDSASAAVKGAAVPLANGPAEAAVHKTNGKATKADTQLIQQAQQASLNQLGNPQVLQNEPQSRPEVVVGQGALGEISQMPSQTAQLQHLESANGTNQQPAAQGSQVLNQSAPLQQQQPANGDATQQVGGTTDSRHILKRKAAAAAEQRSPQQVTGKGTTGESTEVEYAGKKAKRRKQDQRVVGAQAEPQSDAASGAEGSSDPAARTGADIRCAIYESAM